MSFCGVYVMLYTFFNALFFADWYLALHTSVYNCDRTLNGLGLLKEYRSDYIANV
jgi:hypothetical protein